MWMQYHSGSLPVIRKHYICMIAKLPWLQVRRNHFIVSPIDETCLSAPPLSAQERLRKGQARKSVFRFETKLLYKEWDIKNYFRNGSIKARLYGLLILHDGLEEIKEE